MQNKTPPGKISLFRKITQAGGMLLAVAGIIAPGMTHLIYPGLHCYACPLAVTICPVGLLQNLLKTSFPVFPIAMLGIYGILLGRWWCGWVCPFGMLHDLGTAVSRKNRPRQLTALVAFFLGGLAAIILLLTGYRWLALLPALAGITGLLIRISPLVIPVVHNRQPLLALTGFTLFVLLFPLVLVLSTNNTRILISGLILIVILLALSYLVFFRQRNSTFFKFAILLLTLGLALVGADTLFCKLCPSAALSATLPYLALQPSFEPGIMYLIKLAILLFIIALLLVSSRFFCRYLCPLGALFGLANKVSLLKIKRDKLCDSDKKNCNTACVKACPMGIKDIMRKTELTQTDCTRCGKCVEACPNGYLRFTALSAAPQSATKPTLG